MWKMMFIISDQLILNVLILWFLNLSVIIHLFILTFFVGIFVYCWFSYSTKLFFRLIRNSRQLSSTLSQNKQLPNRRSFGHVNDEGVDVIHERIKQWRARYCIAAEDQTFRCFLDLTEMPYFKHFLWKSIAGLFA